jgi:hypothetical protein
MKLGNYLATLGPVMESRCASKYSTELQPLPKYLFVLSMSTTYSMILTAWKTNAYADEEQPPRHGWERISLVRGVALGGWRVHVAVLHLLLLEYIGVELSLQLLVSGPACC